MLQGEMPFGSWRESELETYGKIAKGQLILPDTFSPEAIDLITKVQYPCYFYNSTVRDGSIKIFSQAN